MSMTPHIPTIAASAIMLLATLAAGPCRSASTSTAPDNRQTEVIAAAPALPDHISPAEQQWVDSVMSSLSLREQVAQLFVSRLDITNNAAGFQTLNRILGREKMGGILLGKGTIESYATLIAKAQEISPVPVMITLDGEWGPAMRLTDAPRFPHNIAIGATNDEGLAREFGQEVARQCRLLGIQVNFAPVLDVNSNPDNPVIGFRSFGENPDLVGRLGTAFCMGMADEGIMAVGKHFPGHGDTSTDSHKTLPLVDHSSALLKEMDLKPFEMAINAGMPGVMVGHLKVPALDPSGTPASLSKIITTDWLRDSLQFRGLIFTDALAMKGAVRDGENNCISAFLAGADILLHPANPTSDLNAFVAAVESGRISRAEIEKRCRKVLHAKYHWMKERQNSPDLSVAEITKHLKSDKAQSLIDRLAVKSITAVGKTDGIIPLKADRNTVVVSLGASPSNAFTNECSRLGHITSVTADENGRLSASALKSIREADQVIVAVFKESAAAKTAFSTITAMRPALGVFIINPFRIDKFRNVSNLEGAILAYDNTPAQCRAAAQAIFGINPITGTLPARFPGLEHLTGK